MQQANALVPTAAAQLPARNTERQHYLTFVVGEDCLGINILTIKEILEYRNVTVVPRMPSFIRGVINLRGSVVPVVDLAGRFGRPLIATGRRSCVIIVDTHDEDGMQQDVGVLVDAVNAVVDIAEQAIQATPHFGTGIRADFLHGMGRVDDRFVLLLDTSRVLSMQEMVQLTSPAGAAAARQPD